MCPSLIQIGSKTAEKNSAQTNNQTDRQTNRHYENNGHLAVNQKCALKVLQYLMQYVLQYRTRSSAVAEGPRDVLLLIAIQLYKKSRLKSLAIRE